MNESTIDLHFIYFACLILHLICTNQWKSLTSTPQAQVAIKQQKNTKQYFYTGNDNT